MAIPIQTADSPNQGAESAVKPRPLARHKLRTSVELPKSSDMAGSPFRVLLRCGRLGPPSVNQNSARQRADNDRGSPEQPDENPHEPCRADRQERRIANRS